MPAEDAGIVGLCFSVRLFGFTRDSQLTTGSSGRSLPVADGDLQHPDREAGASSQDRELGVCKRAR
jgi:hypothetical protein